MLDVVHRGRQQDGVHFEGSVGEGHVLSSHLNEGVGGLEDVGRVDVVVVGVDLARGVLLLDLAEELTHRSRLDLEFVGQEVSPVPGIGGGGIALLRLFRFFASIFRFRATFSVWRCGFRFGFRAGLGAGLAIIQCCCLLRTLLLDIPNSPTHGSLFSLILYEFHGHVAIVRIRPLLNRRVRFLYQFLVIHVLRHGQLRVRRCQ
mmetsp:Transcript_5500/g.11975  ORF Transcript_5500/g.11975 Transcript_5500/m.11975 type:complete len:203 (-) Transcript_5500:994-1602(-)